MSANLSVAIVILAAGGASRFGSTKQLARYQGKALLQHMLDVCVALTDSPVYVVLGADDKKISSSLDFKRAVIIKNEQWQEGIASSIRAAVAHIDHANACLFIAADQIKINANHLHELIGAWRSNPAKLVAAEFNNIASIPAVYPSSFFTALSNLRGDAGGKSILLDNNENLISVPMPEAKIDIDYVADLTKLNNYV